MRNSKVNKDLITEELAARIISEVLGDESYIKELGKIDRNLVQRIFDTIIDWIQREINKLWHTGNTRDLNDAVTLFNNEFDTIKALYERALGVAERMQTDKGKASEVGGVMYNFAGENSKTSDKELLKLAQRMKKDGVSDEEIWNLTGWGKGVDGKWRYEIDDSKAKFYKHGNFSNPDLNRYKELERMFLYGDITPEQNAELTALIKTLAGVRKTPKYLSEFLKHDELFEAYPELKDIKVGFFPLKNGNKGVFRASDNLIAINEKLNDTDAKSTLLHEIQHAIQSIEGFTGGSNAEYFKQRIEKAKESRKVLNWIRELKHTQEENPDVTDILKLNNMLRDEYEESDLNEFIPSSEIQREAMEKFYSDSAISYLEEVVRIYGLDKSIEGNDPYDMYMNTSGEVEARDVQNRQDMSADERRNYFPESAKLKDNTVLVKDAVAYSEEKSFAEQVDETLEKTPNGNYKIDDGNHVFVGYTPSILKQIGLHDLPMLITRGHIRDINHEKVVGFDQYHGMDKGIIKKLPDILENPAIIFDSISPKNPNAVCILSNITNEKLPILIAIKPDGNGNYNNVKIDSNFILSMYGKNNPQQYLNVIAKNINNVLFVNKIKTQEMVKAARLQLPAGISNLKSNYIIHKSKNIVNTELYSKSPTTPKPSDIEPPDFESMADMALPSLKLKEEVEKKIDAYVAKYGEMEKGSMPARDVVVPKKTSEKTYVRRNTRTIAEAEAITNEKASVLLEEVANDESWTTYERFGDKQAIDSAVTEFERLGYDAALRRWRAIYESNKRITKQDIADVHLLIQEAAKRNDTKTFIELVSNSAEIGTMAGQVVQAMFLIKRMGPAAQINALERNIKNAEEEINKKFNKSDFEFDVPQEMIDEYNEALLEEERQEKEAEKEGREIDRAKKKESDRILDEIYEHMSKQVPMTWQDKFTTWRYFAMLGNPRTHIRNVVGNATFMPVIMMKNIVAAVGEDSVSLIASVAGKNMERTKSIRSVLTIGKYWKFVGNDAKGIEDILKGEAKYGEDRKHRIQPKQFKHSAILGK